MAVFEQLNWAPPLVAFENSNVWKSCTTAAFSCKTNKGDSYRTHGSEKQLEAQFRFLLIMIR